MAASPDPELPRGGARFDSFLGPQISAQAWQMQGFGKVSVSKLSSLRSMPPLMTFLPSLQPAWKTYSSRGLETHDMERGWL